MSNIPQHLRWGLRGLYLQNRAASELQKSQWLPRQDIELRQMQKLRDLLQHAYDTVPFYHRAFKERNLKPEDIHSQQDLSKLPIITKENVREHSEDKLSSKYKASDLVQKSTSGSTSIPLKVYWCREQVTYQIATKLRLHNWMKIQRNDKIAFLGPPGADIYPERTVPPLRLYSQELNSEKLEKFIQGIRELRPKLLSCYPSSLDLLVQLCERNGVSDINFQAVLSHGTRISDGEKRRTEKVFHSDIFERYSAQDVGTIGYDCPNHSGLHICSEYVMVEFVKDGEPADTEETASLILTPLFSYGMPLIRYEIGDAAHRIGDTCPCGRGLPLMSYVDGRIVDILVAPNGRLMCESNFYNDVFYHIDVRQYRIVQESLNTITVELIPGDTYTDETEKFIVASIKKYMGQEMEVSVRLKDRIEASASGKRRIVVSNVPVRL